MATDRKRIRLGEQKACGQMIGALEPAMNVLQIRSVFRCAMWLAAPAYRRTGKATGATT
jgi:hypothetical protein